MKLSRRDRAACVLALEILRDGAHGPTLAWREGAAMRCVGDAVKTAPGRGADLHYRTHINAPHSDYRAARVFRARLALYLRADAGDYGPPVCQCGRPLIKHSWMGEPFGGWSYTWPDECLADEDSDEGHLLMTGAPTVAPFTPLWALPTPPHGGR